MRVASSQGIMGLFLDTSVFNNDPAMKNILPIITLTTLAAAASAQTAAAPSGLSYNRVGLDYNTDSKGYTLSASALIGSSNFLVEAETTVGGNGNGDDTVSLGYVFKNLALGADATFSVGSNESYGLEVRKDLGNNIELAVGYARSSGVNGWGAELAYNVSKQIQIAAGVSDSNLAGSSSTTDISLRYNF
jgi:hypothetical protein